MSNAAASFVALSREDIAVARTLAKAHPRSAAFHVEQAAEKLLKAVLSAEGIVFSTGHHQLGRLAELLPPDHIWRADLMAFDAYTTFATAMRYPRPGGDLPWPPSQDEIEAAIANVASLIGEIDDWCREKLADKKPKRR